MRPVSVAGFCLLSALAGFLLGELLSARATLSPVTRAVEAASGSDVPVIELTETRDLSFAGVMRGDVRLFAAGEQVLPDASGAFLIPAEPFLTRVIEVPVPDGMRYVASKRGSKYYPVDSSAGSNLSVANRVYFGSKEEAERAGYTEAR